METTEFAVPSVHCRSCQLNIEEALEDVDGVTASRVDLGTKLVAVDFDADVVDPDSIATAIEAAGYPVG